jgi:hypothetical protein
MGVMLASAASSLAASVVSLGNMRVGDRKLGQAVCEGYVHGT